MFSNIFWLTFPRVSVEWLSNPNTFLHPAAPVPHLGRGNGTYLSWQLSVSQTAAPVARTITSQAPGVEVMSKLREKNYFFTISAKKKNTALWCFPRPVFRQGSCLWRPPALQEEMELGGLGGRGYQGAAEVSVLRGGARHKHLVDCKAGLLTVSATPFRRDIFMSSSM